MRCDTEIGFKFHSTHERPHERPQSRSGEVMRREDDHREVWARIPDLKLMGASSAGGTHRSSKVDTRRFPDLARLGNHQQPRTE